MTDSLDHLRRTRRHIKTLGIYIHMLRMSLIHKGIAQAVDNLGRSSTKYCGRIEGRNLVPFSGVIVGKGKGGVGHQVVTVCIPHILHLSNRATVALDLGGPEQLEIFGTG
jgi:hypothetical protein